MPLFTATLHLTDQPVRELGQIDASTAQDAASIISRRFPFLPPAYVWVGDRALVSLLAPPAPQIRPLTKGQTLHRERLRRQRHAERWRQHWIDKDNAKRKQA